MLPYIVLQSGSGHYSCCGIRILNAHVDLPPSKASISTLPPQTSSSVSSSPSIQVSVKAIEGLRRKLL